MFRDQEACKQAQGIWTPQNWSLLFICGSPSTGAHKFEIHAFKNVLTLFTEDKKESNLKAL